MGIITFIYTHTHTHTHVHVGIYVYIYIYIYIYIYTHTHTYTHTLLYVYIYIYIYTHTLSLSLSYTGRQGYNVQPEDIKWRTAWKIPDKPDTISSLLTLNFFTLLVTAGCMHWFDTATWLWHTNECLMVACQKVWSQVCVLCTCVCMHVCMYGCMFCWMHALVRHGHLAVAY